MSASATEAVEGASSSSSASLKLHAVAGGALLTRAPRGRVPGARRSTGSGTSAFRTSPPPCRPPRERGPEGLWQLSADNALQQRVSDEPASMRVIM